MGDLFGDPDLDSFQPNLIMGHKYDELSGNFSDATENGYTGVVYTAAPGPTYGYTPAMDGVAVDTQNTLMVNCGTMPTFPTIEFTWAGWIINHPYNPPKKWPQFFNYLWGCGFPNQFFIQFATTFVYWDTYGWYGMNINVSGIDDGNWHLVILQRDLSGYLHLWTDNVFRGSSYGVNTTSLSGNTWRYMSGRNDNNVQYDMWNGTFDENWLWNTQLDTDARTALWNSGSGIFLKIFHESHVYPERDMRVYRPSEVHA